MKIDVITLHRVRNYGSSLQTLATQQLLQNHGCDVEIVDYYPERYTSLGLLKRLKNKNMRLSKNPVLLLAARTVISISYIKKKIIFDGFLKKYIRMTPKTYRTESELLEDTPKADAYCTGSDQVWNSHWNEGIDRPLYLSFVPNECYKFSYAGSIGDSELSKVEADEVRTLLKEYRHITVRENTGIGIMGSMGFKDVRQMLDPTLLLCAKYWKRYVSNKYTEKKFVLTYNLHHDSKIDQFANNLAKRENLQVYNISYNIHDVIRKGTLKWCPTVEEYLGLIRDAQYVITDSFHATVFSILFQTKFMVIYPVHASSRIRSILELLEMQDRGVDEAPTTEQIIREIDFTSANDKLDQERKTAQEYIQMVLNEIGA